MSTGDEPRAAPRGSKFDFAAAEARWQAAWSQAGTFRADDASPRPKTFVLEMFPYPSGKIHVGHVRNYVMGDVLARARRMQGFEVLHPMGWDAFGMPAENAAIERGVHPGTWTRANIATMRGQLQRLGFALDWSRELATCEPDYYGHEQALFLDLMAAGLVYRKASYVNWDPVDHTVLANEQVIDGRGWRSGAPVERRQLSQWFLKITDFAEELLDGLADLDKWPDKVRLMQENWIGKSVGLRFTFHIAGFGETFDVFTTRPDTLFGASFAAIAPDHPIAKRLGADNPALAAFSAACLATGTAAAEIETQEKMGFDTGLRVVHPLDASRTLPVYVANFVLMDYGTGAIFGCPAHDQRDLDFARKYGLPVLPVVAPDEGTPAIGDEAYVGPGRIVNSEFLDGLTIDAAKAAVIARAEAEGWGTGTTVWRLRDWGVSRQRYWGTPIPVIHCADCGVVPVPRDAAAGRPARRRHLRCAGQPARPPPDVEARRLPAVRRTRDARDRHARHVRQFVVVFHPLCQRSRRRAVRPRRRRCVAAGGAIYRRRRACDPPPALRALLDARAPADRADRSQRAVHRAIHPGDGDARDVPPRQRRDGR